MVEIEAFLSDFSIRLEPLSPATARAAAKLRSRFRRLRLPDAFVLATADDLEADTVLTGDECWASITARAKLIQRNQRPGGISAG